MEFLEFVFNTFFSFTEKAILLVMLVLPFVAIFALLGGMSRSSETNNNADYFASWTLALIVGGSFVVSGFFLGLVDGTAQGFATAWRFVNDDIPVIVKFAFFLSIIYSYFMIITAKSKSTSGEVMNFLFRIIVPTSIVYLLHIAYVGFVKDLLLGL